MEPRYQKKRKRTAAEWRSDLYLQDRKQSGSKAGKGRAQALTPYRRREIASIATEAKLLNRQLRILEAVLFDEQGLSAVLKHSK